MSLAACLAHLGHPDGAGDHRCGPVRAEADLRAGSLLCPGCGGVLRPWAHARTRTIRTLSPPASPAPGGAPASAARVRVRPRRARRARRARCAGCGGTQVLLPGLCQPRRADASEVIGAALIASAHGAGHRRIAADLHRSPSHVRAWLRACPPAHADHLTQRATARIFTLQPDLLSATIPTPETSRRGDRDGHDRLLDAVVMLAASVAATRTRFPGEFGASDDTAAAWSLIAVTSGGLLQRPARARPS